MRATRSQTLIGTAALSALALAPALAQGPAEARLGSTVDASRATDDLTAPVSPTGIDWTAREAEHLLNRAGFGARTSEVRGVVAAGLEATVEALLSETTSRDPFFVERYGPDYSAMREMGDMEREAVKKEVKRDERQQMEDYRMWWFDRLMSGEMRLHERMTLFWHGFFTSSPQGVRRSYELLNQSTLIRQHALGSYADILRAIISDPAMLMYLDNHVNKKGNPNENFARELMELFSLGEGNYTEQDVKEAARALTGRASNGAGMYIFRRGQHDRGMKTILGRTGRFNGDDLVDILLEQDACPRWVSWRLLTYLEGVEPSDERLAEYAAFLREHDFELKPFLRKLFTDEHFYSDEVVGARIAGPVDFMVGISRRIGVEPPGQLLHLSSAALGQKLLFPPNVKGWEGGMAWISTASLMQRGNFAGLMLGVVDVQDVLSDADWESDFEVDMEGEGDAMMGDDSMMEASSKKRGPKMPAELRAWSRVRGTWRNHLNLTSRLKREGVTTDSGIVDALLVDLLAVEASADSRERMIDYLANERRTLGVLEGELLAAGDETEYLLRRLAHLILSLPEAQLS